LPFHRPVRENGLAGQRCDVVLDGHIAAADFREVLDVFLYSGVWSRDTDGVSEVKLSGSGYEAEDVSASLGVAEMLDPSQLLLTSLPVGHVLYLPR